MRRLLKILTSRLMIVAPLVIIQFVFLATLFYRVTLSASLLPFMSLFSFLTVIVVINRDEDPAYKIAWAIIILGAPVVGIPLYILAGNRKVPKKLFNGTTKANKNMDSLLKVDTQLNEELKQEHSDAFPMFHYASSTGNFPVYKNTRSQYFSSGEDWFPVYLEKLKQAKHFIFIEFFIVDAGSVWDEVLEVLKQKVSEGVQVKVIYDDFGSITLPFNYDATLREMGIEAYRFNHVRPAFIIQMNNRDHRKITVIDNQIAFTGGVNLADEYMNRITRFGYWKDSAVMLEGEAVWSYTVMFLGMLSYCRPYGIGLPEYEEYRFPCAITSDGGYYQPYSDTPTDKETMALTMQLNMISHAKKYIYIDTPYLIPTESVIQALMIAAKNGVDVRILTPHIPDKQLVFQITRGNYRRLIQAGVKVYEYLPGFNHAKNFVADDQYAIIGSANMDYRSYFLHYETGVLMYNTPEVIPIREDFEKSLEKSHLVTVEEEKHVNILIRIMRMILNLFIPLV